MVGLNPNTLISTLNVNGLNTPIKSRDLSEWRKKTTHQLYAVYKELTSNIIGRLEVN